MTLSAETHLIKKSSWLSAQPVSISQNQDLLWEYKLPLHLQCHLIVFFLIYPLLWQVPVRWYTFRIALLYVQNLETFGSLRVSEFSVKSTEELQSNVECITYCQKSCGEHFWLNISHHPSLCKPNDSQKADFTTNHSVPQMPRSCLFPLITLSVCFILHF